MLEYASPKKAIGRLDDDERDYAKIVTRGGPQTVNIINESGLYHLILKSQMPRPNEFRRWVTGTVLPSIRRTGKFEMGGQPDQPEQSANGHDASDTEAGTTVTLPRVGRYIVVIMPNGERRVRPTLFSDAIPAMAALDSRAMAYSFMTAFTYWEKLQQLGAFNIDPDGGFSLDKFNALMLASADIARQLLYTHDKPLLNLHH